ncbi:hypothetical protein AAY473_006676 [Plecturocebus cupreus]
MLSADNRGKVSLIIHDPWDDRWEKGTAAAVPLRTGFNLSQSPMGPDTTLTGIPLFKAHSQNLSLCYRTTNNSSCNTTVKRSDGHSVTSAAQLEDKLRVAIEASAASLASLQRQITSLAQVPTNSYARNWMSGRQPNAASSLRPALSRGTSQLTCPPYFAPIQQEVARKSGALYHQKVGM